MVATGHPLATDAGVDVFREGGNAVDAAVTAALTLGVVDGENSGIGGGCLILIRPATASSRRSTAARRRRRPPPKDMFVRDGKPIPNASQTGPLAVGRAGRTGRVSTCASNAAARSSSPRAIARPASSRRPMGSRSQRPGIRDRRQRGRIATSSRARGPFSLHADGKPLARGRAAGANRSGEHVSPDRRAWHRLVLSRRVRRKIGDWMAANGGILTAADFAAYEAKLREPLHSTYRGYQIVGFPPPSSGGIHVAQILNILENFDMRAIERARPARGHAHRRPRRSSWRLPIGRIGWATADFVQRAARADRQGLRQGAGGARSIAKRAIDVAKHGSPPNWRQDVFGRHTTHIAAADAAGNWVAITATVNTTFGSKVIVPGTGVVLNDEMDDFSIFPGMPNAFGLVGAENNSVAPGKRPLSSMSPTIVLDAERQAGADRRRRRRAENHHAGGAGDRAACSIFSSRLPTPSRAADSTTNGGPIAWSSKRAWHPKSSKASVTADTRSRRYPQSPPAAHKRSRQRRTKSSSALPTHAATALPPGSKPLKVK